MLKSIFTECSSMCAVHLDSRCFRCRIRHQLRASLFQHPQACSDLVHQGAPSCLQLRVML
jgi:hypothetical protein